MEALSTLKVLYAEDEEAMAQQMQRAFGEDIALLRHAKNGLEAMEAFERENFDVVITDIQMPVVNGLELARRIKAKNPDFPIIITSAFNDEEYLIEAINIGVKRYLFKPVNLDLLQAYLLDIAQMAAIRQELTQQTHLLEQYRAAIDASAIVSKTDKNGIITYANEAFCRVTGYAKPELIGRNHNIIRHKKTSKAVFEELWQNLRSGQIWRGTLQNRSKSGESFYVDTVIVPTKTRSGETEYLAIRYDATLRESRFRKRESEQDNLLIQQSKLAAMGEMISMIAHQWRQPLSTINALTLDLRTDMDLGLSTPESIAEGLGQINDVTEHLSATINDFRDFFKPDTVAQEMALSTIISRALALTKQSFHARSVAINCELADLPPLPIHPGKVVQVLLNLLKNAEDALMERGVAHPAITIRSMEEHPFQYIEVCDNGGGIPPEALSQIFNPYYSTKGENGTGLGLYMSRMIIERYCRGELSVTNTDAGACFRIKIHTKAIQ